MKKKQRKLQKKFLKENNEYFHEKNEKSLKLIYGDIIDLFTKQNQIELFSLMIKKKL